METPFIGREALDSALLSRHALRTRFTALYPDVYLPNDVVLTARDRALAAWLWSRRTGVLAGRSASAVHGSKWLSPDSPAELLYGNRHCPKGIQTWADAIAEDEIELKNGVRVTTVARTALDLARRNPVDPAVASIDALLNATRAKIADIELLLARYRGSKGICQARKTLDLVDGGAESPRETWLRLLIVRAGFPPPETQIRVPNEYDVIIARVDMGWSDLKIAVEYDGDHHWKSRRELANDIHRSEVLRELDWIVIRVTAEDTEAAILHRIAKARAARGAPPPRL